MAKIIKNIINHFRFINKELVIIRDLGFGPKS
jgi:hypothetical protein